MMLDNYVRDFKALIDWIQLQEKLENTDAQNRWSLLTAVYIYVSEYLFLCVLTQHPPPSQKHIP